MEATEYYYVSKERSATFQNQECIAQYEYICQIT